MSRAPTASPDDVPHGRAQTPYVDPLVLHVLRRLPYCRDLDDRELQWLAVRAHVRTFDAHQQVLSEGGDSGALHVVLAGRARVFKRSLDGREQVLRALREGDSFNEVPVFDGGPDPANVETTTEATFLIISGDVVRELAADSRRFAAALMRTFAERLRGLTRLVETVAFSDVSSRVALLLWQLSERDAVLSPEGPSIRRTLTVSEMASMVGSVREVVSRALTRLESDGVITVTRDRIFIRDAERLQALAR